MATDTVKINDIASQLTTASRLVVSTDFFWVYMASGTQVKIPAEFVKAYLVNGIKPTVNSDGNWEIGGTDTGVQAEGVSPQLNADELGINVSYDNGKTWQTLALYSQMDIGLDDLIATYKAIVSTEQGRVDAETERAEAETERKDSETARKEAETTRVTEFAASKEAADDATAKALSTYSHPPYVDSDGYYYKWNIDTAAYDKTTVNLTGKAFQIKKVFPSVAAMEATDVDTFDENDFLLINTEDTEDEDNAKLYVVAVNSETGKKFYSYLVDMSGFRGFVGKTPQMFIGTVTTLAAGSTASASVTSDGTDTDGNPKYRLNLAIPKGDKVTLADFTDEEIAELQKPATDAIALCNTATDNANTAAANASTATEKADAAAENATDKATTASKLNDTVTAAEASRVAAENARVTAENARAAAESSRVDAESARDKAETSRVSEETTRQTNEKTRQSNESARQSSETTRQANEETRKKSETLRVSAESSRATAEAKRVEEFAASKEACDTATANATEAATTANESADKADTATAKLTEEQAKVEAVISASETATANAQQATEDTLASKAAIETEEETRQANEKTRQSNETTRQSQESTRQTQEATRQSQESSRVTAESSRVTAETSRATAETQREKDFASSKSACDTATSDCKAQTSECKTQTDLAEEQNQHPTYVGDDNYVYKWDATDKAYAKTDLYVKGDNGCSPKIVDKIWWVYNDATREYENTGISVSSDYELTKIKVEGVLTGNITSHTHDQYALDASLTSEVTRAKAREDAIETVVNVINGSSSVDGSFRKAIADLIGGAPEALDTLKEIADKLAEDDDLHAVIEAAIALKADQTALDAVISRVSSLESGSATTIETTGSGNAVTAISKSGTKITATKGVTFLTSHQDISGKADKATTLAGYGITDAAAKSHTHTKSDITDLSLDFSSVTGKPTTLAGYGITDAKIESGKITLGSNSITPLTSHQDISGKLNTSGGTMTGDLLFGNVTNGLCKGIQWTCGENDYARIKAGGTGSNAGYLEIATADDGSEPIYLRQYTGAFSSLARTATLLDGSGNTTFPGVVTAASFKGNLNGTASSASSVAWGNVTDKPTIPTKTSQLTNDSGYITADSLKETVTITLSQKGGSDSALIGAAVTVKDSDGNTLLSTTWQGSGIVLKVKAGVKYTVSCASVSNYSSPSSVTYTASVANTRSVSFSYTYASLGVWILDTSGNLTAAANWDTANNSNAVGVAVITNNCRFVIAPAYASTGMAWASNTSTQLPSVTTTTSESGAKADYAGQNNTAAIVSYLGSASSAAAVCQAYTFKNGKSGYLWSAGEAYAAYQNKSAIDTALSKIGATAMNTSNYHWTSTQYSSSYAWCLFWSNGGVDFDTKSRNRYVRAVCAF